MPSHDENKCAAGIEFYGGYQVYDENGIDLTTLRRNLTLSLENRLDNNARAAAFFAVLRGPEMQRNNPCQHPDRNRSSSTFQPCSTCWFSTRSNLSSLGAWP